MTTSTTKTQLFGAICTVLLSTCCVQSLPYGRAFPAEYFDEAPVEPRALPLMNPWEEAALEEAALLDAPAEWYQDEEPWVEASLDKLAPEYYLDDPRFEIPVFGQINYGEPAEEELRALKRSAHSLGAHAIETNAFEASRVSTLAPPTVNHFLNAGSSQFSASKGQKEVAMLRPPTKMSRKQATTTATTTTTTTTEAPSTEPTAHQITSGERQKKPSPYDTLRKYLSIEDAMKKEAEKRLESRFQKRSGPSSIIAQEQSLTSQLRGLKKHVA